MATPSTLVTLCEPWAQFYSDSKTAQTLVVYGHVAAMLFAGGLAITLDRATLRAAADKEARPRQLTELGAAHRLVITGLVVSVVTGLLLFAADVETYFVSWVYWTKMGLIVLLLANGYMMTRAEALLKSGGDVDAGWTKLRVSAIASLFLWFAIALAGVTLVNAA